jgi:hypothetical protein
LDKFGVLGLGFWVLQRGGGLREDGAGFVVAFDIYYGVARSSSVGKRKPLISFPEIWLSGWLQKKSSLMESRAD